MSRHRIPAVLFDLDAEINPALILASGESASKYICPTRQRRWRVNRPQRSLCPTWVGVGFKHCVIATDYRASHGFCRLSRTSLAHFARVGPPRHPPNIDLIQFEEPRFLWSNANLTVLLHTTQLIYQRVLVPHTLSRLAHYLHNAFMRPSSSEEAADATCCKYRET
jgi:hypothetical protein